MEISTVRKKVRFDEEVDVDSYLMITVRRKTTATNHR